MEPYRCLFLITRFRKDLPTRINNNAHARYATGLAQGSASVYTYQRDIYCLLFWVVKFSGFRDSKTSADKRLFIYVCKVNVCLSGVSVFPPPKCPSSLCAAKINLFLQICKYNLGYYSCYSGSSRYSWR